MDIINNFMTNILHFYNVFVSNLTIDAIIKFIVIYFFILWWAFIIWIVKDITNRTTNILLQVFSILIVIFLTPIFWLPIYLLMRPRRTIFEKYYEEDELNDEAILENELDDTERLYNCPKCSKEVQENFKFCPYCEYKLLKTCPKCQSEVKVEWKICPFCWQHQENKISKKSEVKVEIEKVEKRKNSKKDILSEIESE